jgi:hypothetical protein
MRYGAGRGHHETSLQSMYEYFLLLFIYHLFNGFKIVNPVC